VAKWLSSFRRKQASAPKTVLELMVLEGADAGQQFTVDGAEVRIGRGKPKTGQTGTILLHDKSVSSLQATLRAERSGTVLEHNPDATNPTLVNGRKVSKQKIKPGDQIEMGLVKIEVRQRQGIALSGLLSLPPAGTHPVNVSNREAPVAHTSLAGAATVEMPAPRGLVGSSITDPGGSIDHNAPTLVECRGALTVVRGLSELENETFPLRVDATVVGRSRECDIAVPEAGISRRHCSCEWQGDQLVLTHMSGTNSTCVNGVPVTGSRPLAEGDEILLADRVVLRVHLSGVNPQRVSSDDRATLPPQSAGRPEPDPLAAREPETGAEPLSQPASKPLPKPLSKPRRSLQQYMEDKIERDRQIEEEFSVEGSFVDIDVVGSYKMKAEADRPAHIIVSFERFRAFVEQVIEEFEGQVLNSNGDELMCFFESTPNAVRSASAILVRLDDFNATQNVLSSPFRFRIGIHTGRCLVDRVRGVAYSAVLDTAGHLQKAADVNGLLISEATLSALPDSPQFEPAGTLDHENIPTYRATGPIE
jgi:pSer/pThr/pTyr-binding forkhead associated (FHA) protein/class 3 adenylate cyclase